MIPSLLLLDKPRGFNSFQLVDTVKKKFKLNKVGHTGTLDPIATGFYVGRFRYAPGTVGTLLGVPLAYLFGFKWWLVLLVDTVKGYRVG